MVVHMRTYTHMDGALRLCECVYVFFWVVAIPSRELFISRAR